MGKGYIGCRPESTFAPNVQLSCHGQIALTEIHTILKDTSGSLTHPTPDPHPYHLFVVTNCPPNKTTSSRDCSA